MSLKLLAATSLFIYCNLSLAFPPEVLFPYSSKDHIQTIHKNLFQWIKTKYADQINSLPQSFKAQLELSISSSQTWVAFKIKDVPIKPIQYIYKYEDEKFTLEEILIFTSISQKTGQGFSFSQKQPFTVKIIKNNIVKTFKNNKQQTLTLAKHNKDAFHITGVSKNFGETNIGNKKYHLLKVQGLALSSLPLTARNLPSELEKQFMLLMNEVYMKDFENFFVVYP